MSAPPPPPPLLDCNHSASGLCSKCVLYRAYALKSAAQSSAASHADPATPSTSSATPPSLSREGSLDAASITSSTLQFTGPSLSRFRLLPNSSLDNSASNQQRPKSAITSEPLSIDPAQLSAAMTRLGNLERVGSVASLASPASEPETYTSFSALADDEPPPEIHRKESSSSSSSSSPPPLEGAAMAVTERSSSPQLTSKSLLLRLFESELCDIAMTLHYLHKAKEKGVRSYLGNKLFALPPLTVDFYAPQLLNLIINFEEVAEVIKPYVIHRCKESTHFALDCCWLLGAFGHERRLAAAAVGKNAKSEAEQLRAAVLSDFRGDPTSGGRRASDAEGRGGGGHVRSSSDAMLSTYADGIMNGSGMRRVESSLSTLRYLAPGTLPHGRAFDNGCVCFEGDECQGEESREVEEKTICDCGAARLRAEQEFVRALTNIGERLRMAKSKKEKSCRLISELHLLNAHLPARVWIPLYADAGEHIVLRIPPTGGCVLNSKDKAPYCIYVEVLSCADARRVRLPPRLSEADAELHERLHNLTKGTPFTGNGYHNDELSAPRIVVDERRDQQPATTGNTSEWWTEERVLGAELASETLSQKSAESWNSSEERTISPADISRRLREWVKKPRRQMRNLPDDPSAHAMSEPWEEKRERLRVSSPYGRLPGWQLLPVIVKTGDDLRQELLAYQLLRTLERIWLEEAVPLFLRPYKILILSHDSGMIEPIVNACSLHQIKRNQSHVFQEEGRTETPSLLSHFVDSFGPQKSDSFLKAQDNLVRSAAAYSLACYFLQVKDRHNGNILIDAEGHLIHIDFGFILSASPRNLGFETSPFKLTSEIVDVMGGQASELFISFKALMLQGMLAARKHLDRIMNIVEIMIHGSPLACFRGGAASLKSMRDRFHQGYTENQLKALIDQMVENSRDSLTTRLYDGYQYYSNGIL